MPTQSIDPELANPLKSTQNDIFESPTLERLPIAAIDYLRDPRMRFRTIISLISLLSQTLLIGSAGQHRMPLLSRKTPSRRKQNQLRILGALATVLVRRDEAAAAAGSLERVFVAYNPASPKSDRLKVGPAHTYTPRPDDLSLNAVTAYLVSTRAGQTFDDHAKFIMQFANQFCSDPSPGTAAAGLVRSFITYVVGSSAPKMFLRLNHPKYSKPYFDAIVHLPTSELVWVTKWASPPNLADFSFIRILHGVHGVKFLRRVQQNIAQPPADPHWARVISELPRCRTDDPDGYKLLFPGLWGLAGQLDAIYTESTYREFHQMLCLALIGYRASLNTLVGLSNPTQEDLLEAIDVVCNYLLILRPIADSAAFIDHSSTITNANGLRRCRGSPYVAQEPRS
ncbi:hypothetical protein BD779DRAFT_632756 [Infundibulicybe gibba]|nr:hypothetical protein BD779DRAFT_632756 [Infundibulicybe gibba]